MNLLWEAFWDILTATHNKPNNDTEINHSSPYKKQRPPLGRCFDLNL